MKFPRVYCNPISQDVVSIDGIELHHFMKVRRLNIGDTVELFDGNGTIASAVITEMTKASAKLKIQQRRTQSQRKSGRVIIAVSVAKGSRFDWLISKCTELGVDRIVPVIFDRTVKLAQGAKTSERYNKLAIEASKQCKRNFLPILDKACSLSECLKKLKDDYPQEQMFFGSLAQSAKSILNCKTTGEDVIAFVGPEGGITEQEESILKENGAIGVRLTETVLRIETAAVGFAAILTAKRNAT